MSENFKAFSSKGDYERLREQFERLVQGSVDEVPGANAPGPGNTEMLKRLSEEPMRGPRRVERTVDEGDTINGASDSMVA